MVHDNVEYLSDPPKFQFLCQFFILDEFDF